jgi:two-component system, NtrC family, response regulator AtoC
MPTRANQSTRQVLLVADDPGLTTLMTQALSASRFRVTNAHDVETALSELARAHYHAALVDMRLGDERGDTVLTRARELHDPPVVVMLSGYADVNTVVSAMRNGAADFLEKPVDPSEVVARLEGALLKAAQQRKLEAYEENERRSVAPPRPTTNAMRDTLLLVDKVAATPSSGALLVGESGSGKEVLAARIHGRSNRSAGPFVRINVAAISSSMFEAELFGSVKGAFTDAKATRAGFLASADGGTILLDEIGELRPDDQPKLLRVLEERAFFPVGSDRKRTVDVRVIAATNRDPQLMVDEGRLRPDLFYRLGTVIEVPPLRERPDEILPLAEHFVSTFCLDFGRPICRLTPAAVTLLQNYSWPGNVRQVRNAIERAIMLTEGEEIRAEAFDLVNRTTRASDPGKQRSGLHDVRRDVADAEREQIVIALESAGRSRSQAARILGVSRSTLYEKLKRYNLE